MGSSVRKKKEKKKDFQVREMLKFIRFLLGLTWTESQTQGRQDQGKA
jgi:hypothetical protein